MLKLKDESVSTVGTEREIWFGLGVATHIFDVYGHDCVVTSLTDGSHNPGSLHPKGRAADVRIKQIVDASGQIDQGKVTGIFNKLKSSLQPHGFDVVYEGGVGATPMTTGAHIHIEFDPHPGEAAVSAMHGNG